MISFQFFGKNSFPLSGENLFRFSEQVEYRSRVFLFYSFGCRYVLHFRTESRTQRKVLRSNHEFLSIRIQYTCIDWFPQPHYCNQFLLKDPRPDSIQIVPSVALLFANHSSVMCNVRCTIDNRLNSTRENSEFSREYSEIKNVSAWNGTLLKHDFRSIIKYVIDGVSNRL